MTEAAILLMALLFIGHFLGDFTPLATRRMQEAKIGKGPVGWIAAHAGVHGVLVLAAVAWLRPDWRLALSAAGIEFATHLGIDYSKMWLGVRFPALADPAGGSFWVLFGADQLAHALVLLGIAVLAL